MLLQQQAAPPPPALPSRLIQSAMIWVSWMFHDQMMTQVASNVIGISSSLGVEEAQNAICLTVWVL